MCGLFIKNNFSLPGCTVITLGVHSRFHIDKEHARLVSSLTTDNIHCRCTLISHNTHKHGPSCDSAVIWGEILNPGTHVGTIGCESSVQTSSRPGMVTPGVGGGHFVWNAVWVGLKNVRMKYREPGFPLKYVIHFICQWS